MINREVAIMSRLHHRNIVNFVDRKDCEDTVFLVLEYAEGGELFDRIEPDIGLDEDKAHFYFRQLLEGIEYLHQNGVCHRDLKPENILLDVNGNLKIADFGFATCFMSHGQRQAVNTPCGSLSYVDPVVVERPGHPYDGARADLWSCGCILFVLLTGMVPWDQPTSLSAEYIRFLSGRFDTHPWSTIPSSARDLLIAMLQPEPSRRLSISQIREHPWFRRENPLNNPRKRKAGEMEAGPFPRISPSIPTPSFKLMRLSSTCSNTTVGLPDPLDRVGEAGVVVLSTPQRAMARANSGNSNNSDTNAHAMSVIAMNAAANCDESDLFAASQVPMSQDYSNQEYSNHEHCWSQPDRYRRELSDLDSGLFSLSQPIPSEVPSFEMYSSQTASQQPTSQSHNFRRFQSAIQRMTRFACEIAPESAAERLRAALESRSCTLKSFSSSKIRGVLETRKGQIGFRVIIFASPDGCVVEFRRSQGDMVEFKRFFRGVRDSLPL
eukprot:gnl/Spiro4/26089_TR13014_c0_g1_i1.p1 gnl/Spiro4/26089_TR13014_c0_g1~~gnl/Spiro4/26089_TR13014_c0_g1_i1.p1  ORF type:complete len:562 (+),score=44.26 gnl/Spiro4/26089_TR13014_c0_g1_i1:206-1687(+)